MARNKPPEQHVFAGRRGQEVFGGSAKRQSAGAIRIRKVNLIFTVPRPDALASNAADNRGHDVADRPLSSSSLIRGESSISLARRAEGRWTKAAARRGGRFQRGKGT
jgi:hypothetical protein